MLVWDTSVMGLRDEVRVEGVLVQTHFGPVFRRPRGRFGATPACMGVAVRAGLRTLAILPEVA